MKRLQAGGKELTTLACRAADWGGEKKEGRAGQEAVTRRASDDGWEADAGLPTTLTQTHAHLGTTSGPGKASQASAG